MLSPTVTAFTTLAVLVVTGAIGISLQKRARSRARLWDEADHAAARREQGRVERWLSLAGLRGAGAPIQFAAACCLCLGAAVASAHLLGRSPVLLSAAQDVAGIPVVGLSLARLVTSLPWVAALSLTALPVLFVRARRDRRVAAVEQDLPLMLELLATLAEGGLGFDASLDRVIESQPANRPLVEEVCLYKLEVLAGGSRALCLERMARRLEVPGVTSAVAALVQAEEMGSGLADVLRPLADDLRLRRRERALARAESLPEKLVFPMVLGFLPGLLVWTLGPSFYQLMNTIDSIMRGGP